MKPIVILLTSKKLYRQTEEVANALVKEHEYSQFLEKENQKLLEKIQQLDDEITELYDENDRLHESYMQLLDSNRSFEFINDMLEGEIEHYRNFYGTLDGEES